MAERILIISIDGRIYICYGLFHMDKTSAIKLVSDLANKAVRSYQAVNGHIRVKNYATEENKAARKVYEALTSDPITDEELNDALGG